MNVSFTSTNTAQSFFLNVKNNAVSLTLNEITVYTFDRAGRLVTAVIDGRTYRRGLDNRLLCKWRERRGASWIGRRLWLSDTDARQLLEGVHDNVRSALSALERGAFEQNADLQSKSGIDEAIDWLRRVAAFDVESLARDAERMSSVYRPVTILPPDQYLSLVLQATEGCSYNRCSFCSFYRDRPFRRKQPALGNAILWGDGTVSGNSILLGSSLIWNNGAAVHTNRLLNGTQSQWYSSFVDPSSITNNAEAILGYGENGLVPGMVVGPAGSWFYPPVR